MMHPAQRRRATARRVSHGVATMITAVLGGACWVTACEAPKVGPGNAAAVSLDSIAAPSIVAGDSLRDTLGFARPLHATAYDDAGDPISGFPVRYYALDAGITVDSLTGFAVGDSVRSTPIRIITDAGGLQTTPVALYVVPAPTAVVKGTGTVDDTLKYSLRDSSAVSSVPLSVKVLNVASGDTTPVNAYLVSFSITYPTDTALVHLVNDNGNVSRVDTTDASGVAGRRVRLRPLLLTQANDSVVVQASVLYHGVSVPGSPYRLVLRVVPSF